MTGEAFLLGVVRTRLGNPCIRGGRYLTSGVLVSCLQVFLTWRATVKVGSMLWRHWGLGAQWGVGRRLSIPLPSQSSVGQP